MEAIQLIKLSPKRQVICESIQKMEEPWAVSMGIRTLCSTRWTVRTGAMQAIKTNYKTLEVKMEEASHGTDDCSRHASGVAALMEKFSTFLDWRSPCFYLVLLNSFLVRTLQGRKINVDDSFIAVNACIWTLQRLRIDDKFERFFKLVKTESSDLCEEPVLQRIRQPPRWIDDGAQQHVFLLLRNTTKGSTLKQLTLLMGSLREGSCKRIFLLLDK